MRISNRGTLNEIGSRRSPNGFTLLEIVIVVSVIALFIGLAVPRLPDVAGMRIHRNARKVSMMLQLARTRAVSLRRYYRVDVDLDTSGVSVSYFGPEGSYIPDDEVRPAGFAQLLTQPFRPFMKPFPLHEMYDIWFMQYGRFRNRLC